MEGELGKKEKRRKAEKGKKWMGREETHSLDRRGSGPRPYPQDTKYSARGTKSGYLASDGRRGSSNICSVLSWLEREIL